MSYRSRALKRNVVSRFAFRVRFVIFALIFEVLLGKQNAKRETRNAKRFAATVP